MNGLFKKGFPPKIYPTESIQMMSPLIQMQGNQQVPPDSWPGSRWHSRQILRPVNSIAPASPLNVRASDKLLPAALSCETPPDETREDNAGVSDPVQQTKQRFIRFYQARGRKREKRLSSNRLEWGQSSLKLFSLPLLCCGDGDLGMSRTECHCNWLLSL